MAKMIIMAFPTLWYMRPEKAQTRLACAYAYSDQGIYLSLDYSMNIKLLTEHRLEFLSLKWAVEACQILHLSKCHIVGNHLSL